MLGVVKDVPVPSDIPPVDAAYQLIVPELAVAPRVTVPVPHREPGVVPVIVGPVSTVTFTVPVALPHAFVADTVYIPADAIETLAIDGFCVAEEKASGPLQL